MNARNILNVLKIKKGVRTDKELADILEIKYGALTNWLARDSVQYELIINFAIKNHIDLNEVFGSDNAVFDIQHTDMDSHIVTIIDEKFKFYSNNGGRLLTAPFSHDLQKLVDEYDMKVERLHEALKA